MTARKAKLIGAVAVALTLVILLGWYTHPVITAIGVLLSVCANIYGWWRRHYRAGSAARVERWKAKSDKHHGLASFWSIMHTASWWSLRRKARVLCPPLLEQSWWARWWSTPISHLGTRLIRSGWVWVRASVEEHTIAFGGPRQGKSGRLGGQILGTPGAVVTTSTGADLIRLTMALRSTRGPCRIFNPAAVGGLESTMGWDLLDGCEEHRTAVTRATDLMSATPLAGNDRQAEWAEMAAGALAVLMHAAALSGRTMNHVQKWVASADTEATAREVLGYLKSSPEPAVPLQALAFFNSGKSLQSICLCISPALRWLTDPAAVAAASSGTLDVEEFLASNGTIYLIAEKDGPVAPLITALAGHIMRTARRIADTRPHERLTPPLTAVLDEAPSICTLPLDAWLADMGKRNIGIHVGAQSLSQLRQRWGVDGAGAMLTNCAALIVFGGTKDGAGLEAFATLAGGAVTKSQIQQLPPLNAMVLRNGLRPVVGPVAMAWERWDYRKARHADRWGPRLAVLTSACRAILPKRPAKPVPVRLALPVGGTAKTEHAQLLAEHGLAGKRNNRLTSG